MGICNCNGGSYSGDKPGINPFDQPDVESAKVRAREMVALYMKEGALGEGRALPPEPKGLNEFLKGFGEGNYIAVHAYVKPSEEAKNALSMLRNKLRSRYHTAVTLGYGPRFLHSTGQLHKGDAGKGFFIQLTSENTKDVQIPDTAGSNSSGITFGVLKQAQALGDKKALEDKGRKVIHVNLGTDVPGSISRLSKDL